ARGSAAEVRSMLYTALDNQYIDQEQFEDLLHKTQDIGKLLTGFIKKLSPQQQSDNKTIRQ
ncbi:four helix bundle protein, partial [Candidatus Saccharibacteria bacterium]|nr:four helix bundle protein [Candidatus Saccharibacteria bacterium]